MVNQRNQTLKLAWINKHTLDCQSVTVVGLMRLTISDCYYETEEDNTDIVHFNMPPPNK